MAQIDMETIKTLRERTGAGVLDCKKALVASDGDIDKAIDVLREKGLAKAVSKASREAADGMVFSYIHAGAKLGVLVELNCETDFVSRGEGFQSFSDKLAKIGLQTKSKDIQTLLDAKMDTGLTVKDEIDSLMSSVGEKVEIRRVKYYEMPEGFIAFYVHFGSKLGGMLAIESKPTEQAIELGKKIAIQLVAMNPIALNRDSIPAEIIEKEKEIYTTVAKNEGKDEKITERIVNNKLEKYYQENCLLDQQYINEQGVSVNDIIKRYEKESSEKFVIKDMVRFECGL